LSAAIVEELELIWVCCGWRMLSWTSWASATHITLKSVPTLLR
jgi:hypothetical protein